MTINNGSWPRHILVTGGCGYVGSALVPHLLRQPEIERVTVIDNLARGRLESIGYLMAPFHDRLSFMRVDIRKEEQVQSVFKLHGTPDAIVHLAATVDAATSVDEDKRILCEQVNLDATLRLATLAKSLGVRQFVYHSSTSVYGDGRDVVFTEEGPAPNPLTPYGKTKLASEQIVREADDRMAVVVLRPASVFGYAPGYRYEVAVNLLHLYAHFGVPLTIYRTAENESRPYLAIEDAVQALCLALQHPERLSGDIWNVVSFNASLKEIVETIRRIYPNVTTRYTDAALINQISFIVSGEKLYRAGFTPCGNLQTSLEQVRDYLNGVASLNAAWFEQTVWDTTPVA